jgi:hypothetical protein
MCSIHIDKSTACVDCCTTVKSYVYLFKRLNNLLDRLSNQRMMHGSQSDTLKWVRGSQKYAHYCSGATLHGL